MTLKEFASMTYSVPGGDVKIGVSKHYSESYLGDFDDPDDFTIMSDLTLGAVLSPKFADAVVKTICPVAKNYIRVQVMDPTEED